MKRLMCLLVAVVALAGVVASMAPGTGQAGQEAAPIFVTDMPPGYRDWRLISVAHEAGDLNDIRAILGNDVAIKAYREGTRPFPDGTIIARLAWSYDASEENNSVFGRPQSFVAGPPKKRYVRDRCNFRPQRSQSRNVDVLGRKTGHTYTCKNSLLAHRLAEPCSDIRLCTYRAA